MKTRVTPVVPVKVELICEVCGASMYPTGQMLMGDPPKHFHTCGDRSHGMPATEQTYPHYEFRDIH